MKTLYLKSVDSTQNYLKDLLKNENLELPFAVISEVQTNGIGSRDNLWSGLDGNLFLSFAISLEQLPKDLKIESCSIYFAYLLKETLSELNSSVWLKWPNDFYIDKLKIGGMITNLAGDNLICGVGLNLVDSPKEFTKLDIEISKETLLNNYFNKISERAMWKQIFSKYKLEFNHNKNFFTHINNKKISLEDAELYSDGSIIINNERIYSLR